MPPTDRMVLERKLLRARGLDQFDVYHSSVSGRYEVNGVTFTNVGNQYRLQIPIPGGFPHSRPPLYITDPNPLYLRDGRRLAALDVSHQMHTLSPSVNGNIQICHWRDDRWHAGITLDKVLIKGLIWLEAYEQHRSTGQSINHFVTTMREA